MRRFQKTSLFALLALPLSICLAASAQTPLFSWDELLPLPEAHSGHFSGLLDGRLIVAGGASWPVSPFEGGTKVWHDWIFVLEDGAWRQSGALDRPIAYGASVIYNESIFCVGGSDGSDNYATTFFLEWRNGEVIARSGPDLPSPCAMTSAAIIGDTVYVAGGQESPTSTSALQNFWSLDLSQTDAEWEVLPPWPGPTRILPVTSAQAGALYMFSGASLEGRAGGAVGRQYLTDGYRYIPRQGWSTVADVPWPVVAAPVAPLGQAHIIVFGGDDGSNAERNDELADNHPGFRKEILAYHTITDTWVVKGELPETYVTTTAITTPDGIAILGGEDRPGHRAQKVLLAIATPRANSFGVVNLLVVTVYFALLVAVGLYFSRREKTTEDFFLGGKRVPWWAMGLSIFGTQLSAITFLSIPARAYATDWVYAWANMAIVIIAPYVVFIVLPVYRRKSYMTAYEYLEDRFNLPVRIYGSLVFLLFQAGRMGIVLFLPALALRAATGVNVYLCIITMGILATLYTVLGGIEAVIWTDVAQVFVLTGGVVISLIVVLTQLDGGVGELITVATEADKFHMNNWTWDPTTTALWVCIIGNIFAVAYPYTADQTLVQRYLASASKKDAARAIWTNAILSIPATLIFFLMGTALFVFFKANPETLDPTLQNDGVFPLFIIAQLPIGVSGLVIAAIFAAAMSSLDSSLNSISTVCVNDFYKRFRSPFSDEHGLKVARALTVVFGILGTGAAALLAGMDVSSIFDQYMRILGLTGGGLAGLLALGIASKRANGVGGLIGAIVSGVVVYGISTYTELHAFLFGMTGFITSFAVGWIASLPFTGKKLRAAQDLTQG